MKTLSTILLSIVSVAVSCTSDIQPLDTEKTVDIRSLEDDETLVFILNKDYTVLNAISNTTIPNLHIINDSMQYNKMLYCYYRSLPHQQRADLPEIDFSRYTI